MTTTSAVFSSGPPVEGRLPTVIHFPSGEYDEPR
jgi:hypothetical protein